MENQVDSRIAAVGNKRSYNESVDEPETFVISSGIEDPVDDNKRSKRNGGTDSVPIEDGSDASHNEAEDVFSNSLLATLSASDRERLEQKVRTSVFRTSMKTCLAVENRGTLLLLVAKKLDKSNKVACRQTAAAFCAEYAIEGLTSGKVISKAAVKLQLGLTEEEVRMYEVVFLLAYAKEKYAQAMVRKVSEVQYAAFGASLSLSARPTPSDIELELPRKTMKSPALEVEIFEAICNNFIPISSTSSLVYTVMATQSPTEESRLTNVLNGMESVTETTHVEEQLDAESIMAGVNNTSSNESKRTIAPEASVVEAAPYVGIIANRKPSSETVDFETDGQPDSLTRLKDLDAYEQSLQSRYWGKTDADDLVRCEMCCQDGHQQNRCPSRTCKHCKEVDAHFTHACPTFLKCPKCQERGHERSRCPAKLLRSSVDGFSCDLCGGNHIEGDCSLVWRTFKEGQVQKSTKIDQMHIFCYECGMGGHFGDDCNLKPPSKVRSNTIFSARFANNFLTTPIPETVPHRHQTQTRSSIRVAGENVAQNTSQKKPKQQQQHKQQPHATKRSGERPSQRHKTTGKASIDDRISRSQPTYRGGMRPRECHPLPSLPPRPVAAPVPLPSFPMRTQSYVSFNDNRDSNYGHQQSQRGPYVGNNGHSDRARGRGRGHNTAHTRPQYR